MRLFQQKIILIMACLICGLCSSSANAGTILVTNVLSNSVSLFDEASLLLIKELKVGYMPHEVIVSPNGKIALVSNFGDLVNVIPGETLTTINIEHARILKTIKLPARSRPHGLAMLSDTEALVTAQGIQSLLMVNIDNGQVEKKLSLPGAGAHMVLVDAEQRFAYVANMDSGSVVKIDLKSFSIVKHVRVGKEAEGLAFSENENLLLVTDRVDNYVAVIRTKDLSLYKQIKTACGPVRIEMFDHGKSAVITNAISGNAQVIDLLSLATTNTFKTTHSLNPLPVPINIHVNQDQETAYITNSFANDITLVDLKLGKILKTFKAGCMPDGIALSSAVALNIENSLESMYVAGPVDINADIETVWHVAKNVEDYKRISRGAVSAHVEGAVEPGKIIQLLLYPDSGKGKFIPASNETITVVDDTRKILAWTRELPDSYYTERYQLLEKISDHQTRSIIVLRIPGPLGELTKLTFGKTITDALSDLNNGMKQEAELFSMKA